MGYNNSSLPAPLDHMPRRLGAKLRFRLDWPTDGKATGNVHAGDGFARPHLLVRRRASREGWRWAACVRIALQSAAIRLEHPPRAHRYASCLIEKSMGRAGAMEGGGPASC